MNNCSAFQSSYSPYSQSPRPSSNLWIPNRHFAPSCTHVTPWSWQMDRCHQKSTDMSIYSAPFWTRGRRNCHRRRYLVNAKRRSRRRKNVEETQDLCNGTWRRIGWAVSSFAMWQQVCAPLGSCALWMHLSGPSLLRFETLHPLHRARDFALAPTTLFLHTTRKLSPLEAKLSSIPDFAYPLRPVCVRGASSQPTKQATRLIGNPFKGLVTHDGY